MRVYCVEQGEEEGKDIPCPTEGLSFLLGPDPTGMAPVLVAATMVGLFEGTLALLRWTGN